MGKLDLKPARQLVGLLALGWLLMGAPATGKSDEKPGRPSLVIATYDSIVAKHGLGPEIFPRFEKLCGCQVKALASGDGAQLLSRLAIDAERKTSQAQIVLGLDEATWGRARPYLEEWGAWVPRGYKQLIPAIQEARLAPGFLPFDYGVLAFMSDREALGALHLEAPRKLADLLGPSWRRNVILEDPRTSTPGLAFLLYADIAGGPGFWPRFRTQWLTLAPGWDGAYGLFLKKEAPLVWSYTTSQAYHEANGDRADEKRRYRALVFDEGNPMQIEGASLVKGTWSPEQKKLAREFLEFLLSPEVQAQIPLKNWMLPVMPGVALPDSFRKIPQPVKLVRTPVEPQEVEVALARWKTAIGHAP